VTVALAADAASPALTSPLEVVCDPTLGSNTRTRVSQKIIRNNKRISLLAPTEGIHRVIGSVAGTLEMSVRTCSQFLSGLNANARQVLRQF
jgi:hypothetical protein